MRNLKCTFVLILLIAFLSAKAQVFHFNDTTTTLTKTIDQSPAHWYLEIFNDVGVDTTLRWKADLSGVVSGWVISLDDQDNYHAEILHNDSSDFTLFSGLSFPQKLIIGNTLNETAGIGSVMFCIFDPANPAEKQNIVYEFIISASSTSVRQVSLLENVIVLHDRIHFTNDLVNSNFEIYAMDGALLETGPVTSQIQSIKPLLQGVYLLRVYNNHGAFSAKFRIIK